MDVEAFITRWTAREGGAERANYQMFLAELCDVIGVARPQPAGAQAARNDYVFERAVRPRKSAPTVSPKRIDLYKKGAFILEAKQSRQDPAGRDTGQVSLLLESTAPLGKRDAARGWDAMMQNARRQAEDYVFLLDADHAAPPFLITCDVGHCLELFADFSGTGRAYDQFPDRKGYRVFMEDLRQPEVRDRLAAIWTNPASLDPARETARVTREIAARLADVSKALEKTGANAEDVAHFLMRCLFTMFAEDTELLPTDSFKSLLERCVADPAHFGQRLKALWGDMDKGAKLSFVIDAPVRHFNGGLFVDTTVFDLGREEIGELLAAARADWKLVDPAIFGTLLEQALDKTERKKLGAHYTPRAYVQRLVDVTIMEPLRADWQAALTRAETAREDGDAEAAVGAIRAFHHQLCTTRVLDPACGTGNFLYVSLELMKKLEGEVLQTLADMGETQVALAMSGETVDPHQFLGLELNPRAAAIAELVVWIGYLQWHYRNQQGHPNEPILRAFRNINFGRREGYDAVLSWDGYPVPKVEVVDGRRVETYPNPRRPAWPGAEFIVGNPPFIGNKRMNSQLGENYVRAVRSAWSDVPELSDLVMYWWHRAAALASASSLRRFGLVTTNSITMAFNRTVVDRWLSAKAPVSIVYAVPDHPWSDGDAMAAVRIAMTVAEAGSVIGILQIVENTRHGQPGFDVLRPARKGKINALLTVGAKLDDARPLIANSALSYMGVIPVSLNFVVTEVELSYFGISTFDRPPVVARYLGGKDLTDSRPSRFIIDFFGLAEGEARRLYPQLFQRVLEKVKPFRDTVARRNHRLNWWIFGEARPGMRSALSQLNRFIGTTETSKHRWFTMIGADILPDQKIRVIASADAAHLALLSSHPMSPGQQLLVAVSEKAMIQSIITQRASTPSPSPTPTSY